MDGDREIEPLLVFDVVGDAETVRELEGEEDML